MNSAVADTTTAGQYVDYDTQHHASITAASLKERKAALADIAKEDNNDVSASQQQQLLQHIDAYFETLLVYSDSCSVRLVVESMSAAFARAPADLKPMMIEHFLRKLAVTAKQIKPALQPRYLAQNTLLKWTMTLLQQSKDHFTATPASLASLINIQSSLIVDLSSTQLHFAQSTFKHYFELDRSLTEIYINYLKSIGEAAQSPSTLYFYGYLLATLDSKAIAASKDFYLSYYNKVVLSSTTPIAIDRHRLFVPLFKLIDLNDFTTVLLPTIGRFIKRAQEEIATVTALILESVSFDLSTLTKSHLIPMLAPILQVANINKKLVKSSFALIVSKTQDAKALQSSLDELFKPLSTPGNIGVKLNALYALRSIVNSSNNQYNTNEKLSIAKAVVTPVTTYLEKEITKTNRINGFKLVGSCLQSIDLLSDNLIKLITNSLKSDEDATKATTILALARAFTQSGTADDKLFEKKYTQINTFSESINAILKNIKNAVTCDTATTAAALKYQLVLATKAPASIGGKLQSDKQFALLLFSNTSFVHQANYLNRTNKTDEVAALLADIVRVLKPMNAKANERSVYASLVQLLLHPSWHCRKAASQTIHKLHSEQPDLTNQLFVEFVKILDSHSQTPTVLSTDVYSSALKATLSKTFDQKNYPSLALVSNHPFVGHCWRACLTIIGTTSRELLQAQHEQLTRNIVHYLFTHGLHNRKLPIYQQAFKSAMKEFSRVKSAMIVENSIGHFAKSLSSVAITGLTPMQLAIHASEEGVLYLDKQVVDEEKRREEERIASETRRGKAPKKKTAEEEKEEALRRKQEEKKKKESGELERQEKERQRQIAEQSAIRSDINMTIAIYHTALETISEMALASPLFAGEYLSILYLPVLELFKNNYTHEAAMNTYKTLTVMAPASAKLSLYYATMVTYLISNIYATPVLSDLQILSSQQKVLTHVRDITKTEPLPASAFNFFWPLVKNGLEKTVSYTMQELSMEIIEKHTSQGQPFPRGSMIASLIIVVATCTRLETQARASIFQIISGVEESDVGELMDGLISQHHQVRLICLQALEKIPSIFTPSFQWEDSYVGKLWFARSDPDATTSALADKLWNSSNQAPPVNRYIELLKDSTYSSHDEVRKINAQALRAAAALDTATIRSYAIDHLILTFESNSSALVKETKVTANTRRSVATALSGVGSAVSSADDLKMLFQWLIETGLYDTKQDVVQELIQTGIMIIGVQGSKFSGELLQIFEEFLGRPDSGTGDEDSIRASVSVLMGALAKHMEDGNPRIIIILDKLIAALSTPSEAVQVTISKCLTQLMAHSKKQGERLIPILLENIKSGGDYATRRGNAFGLGGAIKGLGISSLKTYNIMVTLTSYVEDKRHPASRQGSLFAFECLCNILGRVFEPYIIQIIPKLLVCFGDSAADVRTATSETARAIMSQLSGHGVKIVLPALLKAIDDRQWRTKEGSIELLGAMAFCAPKQLSSCLPTIVPKLTNVLNDSHIKVQQAAKESLSHIGSVIRNPEIQVHVPLILKTYDDPDIYSRELLENLLSTNYIHTIDPASLSLIMPILERTLKERSSEIKKMTCQIVGNLCSLTEPKELVPYLGVLVPVLQNVLVDPIPEVRAICARALGLLVRGMGEEYFTNLVPWMLETLKSELGPVERSGAAQGLSEVLAALDISRFNTLIGELLTMANSTRAHVREGVMSMFIFTPISFGQAFLPYLPKVLPQVLKGLADDSDPVREVCMRCGQSIINQYAVSGIEVIVPSLERVLFHENWRIRLSCVTLFGDLMFKLGGAAIMEPTPEVQATSPTTSGKSGKKDKASKQAAAAEEEAEEEGDTIAQTKSEIYNLLGKERLDRILSSLYMMRFDNNISVRQKVLLIWKYVVNNTPKTLREILPSLIEMIIASIGSSNIEKRQVAARTLGDVVSKLGDRILPEILPILERGLNSDEFETRQGVCIGLTEVISSARTQLQPFLSSVVTCISRSLCDPLIDVREASAKAFDQLHLTFGSKASNDILPSLIQKLDSSNASLASNALDGLRQLVLIKSSVVLPFIVPKLLVKPISTSNAQALASLTQESGAGLHTHLATIIPAMIEAFSSPSATNAKEVKTAAVSICRSIDEEGLEVLIPLLLEEIELPHPNIRLGACELIGEFCSGTTLDLEDYIDSLIVGLLSLFVDPEPKVQVGASQALLAITKTIKKENLQFISSVQSGVQKLAAEVDSDTQTVPAFCIPKGLAPVLPILLNGLRYGTADQRELATNTLHQVITLTSQDGVKASAMEITGPLILTIGDKFPWGVKAAILQTLSLLITKCPASMKIFLHQLQPTFIKSLADPHKVVRNNAATALGLLMTLSPSVDQLVNSLVTGIGSTDATSQEVKLKALHNIFEKKPKIDQANLEKALVPVAEFLFTQSDELRLPAAQVIGSSSKCFASVDALSLFIKTHLLSPSGSVMVRYGKSLAIGEIMKVSGKEIVSSQTSPIAQIISTCLVDLKDEKAPIRESSSLLADYILRVQPTYASELIPGLCALITDQATAVAIGALNIIKRYCKAQPSASRQYLSLIIPPTMARLRERSSLPLKLASERALVHSLQIFQESVVMDDYIKTVTDQALITALVDYHKRVLMKLNPDSDTEQQ
ncbi:hypothetical protein SAMD00019534_048650 [Acytostelium subglobosum LB1]|uniref:hypothetical protein n=1 Tax=Acytostelium subglobosum LB1 TaxID=1410327 RepID=UPI000644B37D|nr:hypothetical protein SAMD00019534_048650 [Acytostelium subglobosum LB1]GAM21690.1 hypothetical protein SAMD00019534_048650 [Acytostelium subglobosum LB1]|eukprot:XP_012755809.1 hypothetical protein SAMD00019534_048650 [Acytostelium subglobosum LB1]